VSCGGCNSLSPGMRVSRGGEAPTAVERRQRLAHRSRQRGTNGGRGAGARSLLRTVVRAGLGSRRLLELAARLACRLPEPPQAAPCRDAPTAGATEAQSSPRRAGRRRCRSPRRSASCRAKPRPPTPLHGGLPLGQGDAPSIVPSPHADHLMRGEGRGRRE
jgi:hypothetical protein